MLFTADQLVAHAVGDYIIQSQWMSDHKRKNSVVAAIHAATYTLPFVLLTTRWEALAAICITHFLVDRFGLARFLVWLKNWPFVYDRREVQAFDIDDPDRTVPQWAWHMKPITATGYPDRVPPHIRDWLLIIADNIIHVICNALAIAVLG